jgi:hypothetical protein
MSCYKLNITVTISRQLIGFPIQKIRPDTEKYNTRRINKNIQSGAQTSEPRSPASHASHTARLPDLVKEIELRNYTSREYWRESKLTKRHCPSAHDSHIHQTDLSKSITKSSKIGPSLQKRKTQPLEKVDQGWINECWIKWLTSREKI